MATKHIMCSSGINLIADALTHYDIVCSKAFGGTLGATGPGITQCSPGSSARQLYTSLQGDKAGSVVNGNDKLLLGT